MTQENETTEREITRGDNNPPELLPSMPLDVTEAEIEALKDKAGEQPESAPPFDLDKWVALVAQVAKFTDACGAWRDVKQVNSQVQSERLTDFISGARALYKSVDDVRVESKKPYDDLAQAVQDAFKPLLDKLKKAADILKPMQADWLTRENARIADEKAAAAAAAEAKRVEAERLAAEAAARNDVSGEVEAEALAKEAAKEARAANRTVSAKSGSASGGGRSMAMRTITEVNVVSIGKAIMHYRDAPEMLDLIKTLAAREARSSAFNPKTDTIPGVDVTTRQVAA